MRDGSDRDGLRMSLIEDVRAAFKAKGLTFVSIAESTSDSEKTVLTYKDAGGNIVTRDVDIRLSELEDTVAALAGLDPEDLANFLLA